MNTINFIQGQTNKSVTLKMYLGSSLIALFAFLLIINAIHAKTINHEVIAIHELKKKLISQEKTLRLLKQKSNFDVMEKNLKLTKLFLIHLTTITPKEIYLSQLSKHKNTITMKGLSPIENPIFSFIQSLEALKMLHDISCTEMQEDKASHFYTFTLQMVLSL